MKKSEKNGKRVLLSWIFKEKLKCPFTGAGTPPKNPTGKGTSNKDWWPNGLNLKMLSQHSSLVNPMDKKFSYAKEFKKLNYKQYYYEERFISQIRSTSI